MSDEKSLQQSLLIARNLESVLSLTTRHSGMAWRGAPENQQDRRAQSDFSF